MARSHIAIPVSRQESAHWGAIVLAVLAALTAFSGPAFAQGANDHAIHVYVFLSKTCPHCEAVEAKSLAKQAERLHCRIEPHYYDVDDLADYMRLVVLEERLGDRGNDLPVAIIGGNVLGGTKEIESKLEGIITELRAAGSPPIEVPSREEAKAELQKKASVEPSSGSEAVPLYLAYFEEPGCRQCARMERVMKLAAVRSPTLEVRRYDRRSGESAVVLEALCERAQVPPERRLLLPAIAVGDRVLIQEDITDAAVGEACSASRGKAPIWEITDAERESAQTRLWQRSRNVSLAAVALGGLVDGVNPCAFATLVFFVCCLAGAGRDWRAMALAGGGFAAGVFMAYFTVGIGLSEALLRLSFLPRLSAVVTWTIIALTLLLGILSFRDFLIARRGQVKEMTLRLPHKLRMKINALIARRLRLGSLLAAGLVLGATISLLEFICTGQVYLPLIRYMVSVSGGRARGIGLLLLYNAAFVLPLVLILAAVCLGLGSDRLLSMFRQRLPATKLALAVFFLALGGLMAHLQWTGML